MTAMLATARREGWAVAAFNPVDYASVKAIVRTADALAAPVIVQTSAKTVKYYGASTIAGWLRELAGAAAVPVALHLDHGKDLRVITACLEAGWTDVMIDASDRPLAENLAVTREVVELARALSTEPKLLLLDEPSSGLNVEETGDMAFWIDDIRDQLGITVLMVEHDMTLVSRVSDRVVALNQGQVLAAGTPREVQTHPGVIEAYLGSVEDVSSLRRPS